MHFLLSVGRVLTPTANVHSNFLLHNCCDEGGVGTCIQSLCMRSHIYNLYDEMQDAGTCTQNLCIRLHTYRVYCSSQRCSRSCGCAFCVCLLCVFCYDWCVKRALGEVDLAFDTKQAEKKITKYIFVYTICGFFRYAGGKGGARQQFQELQILQFHN